MSKAQLATNDKPSSQCHKEFRYIRSRDIESLNIRVEEYEHPGTGARHFHMVSDSSENVFLVALRTVPMDSTGVAHMLEHTVLCGSEKYPVRDPFFMMIRRSLNTFMNAFTSSDWTAYPFASQNKKDFNNLLDVYLDAVFFSRLHELDFSQEGHRVEFEKAGDSSSPLVFKGVVFNEMKGAMSSPISTLWHTVCKYLFPSTTYHYNSGGDPENIPDLSHEELKSFYKTHYHPGNAIFMTFGDIPVFELQEKIHEQALSRFEKTNIRIYVPPEKRYDSPVIVEEPYALDDTDDSSANKTHIVLSWLLGRGASIEDVMKANLMSSILLDDSASPLQRALETTDLGSAPSPLCGLEDSNYEMSFMCGLEGSNRDSAEEVEKLVFDVLNDVATNGVPQDRIEAVLHQLELSQREIGGDGYPYGLQLVLAGLSAAIHRVDPVEMLDLDPALEKLREAVKQPNYIQNLVKEYLLDNPHRVRMTLYPDTNLSAQRKEEEASRLEGIKSSLSDQEKEEVISRATLLAERQKQEDDPEILPKVGLDDVPESLKIPVGIESKFKRDTVTLFEQGTNGLVYQQLVSDLPDLDDSQLDILPLYTSLLTNMGVADRSYLETQEWQTRVSGGLSASTSMRGATDNVQDCRGYFVFSGKALVRNHDKLSDLMSETFHKVRFDETARMRELISQKRARAEQSVTGSGHALAMTAACSGMSPTALLAHRTSGLQGIKQLKSLDDSLKENKNIEAMAESMSVIHQSCATTSRQFLLIGEKQMLSDVQTYADKTWSELSVDVASDNRFSQAQVNEQIKQMWVTSTQVNFCSKAYPTVPMDHEDAAPLSVLGGFMRNGFLHTAIRENGGAYGGGASHEPGIAAFRFYSYRDPRLQETLDDFDQSIKWVVDGHHEWRQVEEAILGIISGIDKPGSPAGEAKQAFHNNLFGRTTEKLERFRSRVLEVKLDDIQRVAALYLNSEHSSTVVITDKASHNEVGDLGLDVIQL